MTHFTQTVSLLSWFSFSIEKRGTEPTAINTVIVNLWYRIKVQILVW